MGKSVWLDDEVLDEVAERARGDESPNQTLRRVLLDDDEQGIGLTDEARQQVREMAEDIAEQEARDLIEKAKQGYL